MFTIKNNKKTYRHENKQYHFVSSYWWNERKWINNQIKCAGQCIDKIIGNKVDCLPPCSQFFLKKEKSIDIIVKTSKRTNKEANNLK